MAVTATTTSVSYAGNGSTTVFAVPFKFISSTDLLVTKTVGGVTSSYAMGSQYSVSGAGSDSGGTVNFVDTPQVGDTVTIKRSTPATQPASLQVQGVFSAKVHEAALDRATLVEQETQARTASLETRLTTAEAALTALGLPSVTSVPLYVSIKEHGAKVDGATNDYAAIAATIAAVSAAGGGVVVFPPGTTVCLSTIAVPQGVSLMGLGLGVSIVQLNVGSANDGLVFAAASEFSQGGFVRDISLRATDSAGLVRDVVSLKFWSGLRFSNVEARGAGRYNLYIANCIDLAFDVCDFNVGTSAALYTEAVIGDVSTTLRFNKCYFHNTTNGWGVDAGAASGTFTDCIFESNGAADRSFGGVRLRDGGWVFRQPYFENNASWDMYAGTSGNVSLRVDDLTVVSGTYKQTGFYGFKYDRVNSGATLGGTMTAGPGCTSSIVFTDNMLNHAIEGLIAPFPPVHIGGANLSQYPGYIYTSDVSGYRIGGNLTLYAYAVNFFEADASSYIYRVNTDTLRTPGSFTVGTDLAVTGPNGVNVTAGPVTTKGVNVTGGFNVETAGGGGFFCSNAIGDFDIGMLRAAAGKGALFAGGGAAVDWTLTKVNVYLAGLGITALTLENTKATFDPGMKLVLGSGDTTGTPGNATINKATGKVKMPSSASTLTVVNSLVTASSLVKVWVQQAAEDATMTRIWPEVSAGQFIIHGNANSTAATVICFEVLN
jgi:hypothetical protein